VRENKSMNFRRKSSLEDPEINFIPLIDVLLVIIIFLVVSTTFSKFSELKINLPIAEANQSKDKDDSINIIITEDGQYSINERIIEAVNLEKLVVELKAESNGKTDMPVIINADAMTTHQSVVDVMEASRLVGLNRITFSTKVK
jgi:biopolymer transport protein ExbD|tara:strand:+ start:328 stop:759 length:432 start_codon:yes stop_codon:yes gene_type:complete